MNTHEAVKSLLALKARQEQEVAEWRKERKFYSGGGIIAKHEYETQKELRLFLLSLRAERAVAESEFFSARATDQTRTDGPLQRQRDTIMSDLWMRHATQIKELARMTSERSPEEVAGYYVTDDSVAAAQLAGLYRQMIDWPICRNGSDIETTPIIVDNIEASFSAW